MAEKKDSSEEGGNELDADFLAGLDKVARELPQSRVPPGPKEVKIDLVDLFALLSDKK